MQGNQCACLWNMFLPHLLCPRETRINAEAENRICRGHADGENHNNKHEIPANPFPNSPTAVAFQMTNYRHLIYYRNGIEGCISGRASRIVPNCDPLALRPPIHGVVMDHLETMATTESPKPQTVPKMSNDPVTASQLHRCTVAVRWHFVMNGRYSPSASQFDWFPRRRWSWLDKWQMLRPAFRIILFYAISLPGTTRTTQFVRPPTSSRIMTGWRNARLICSPGKAFAYNFNHISAQATAARIKWTRFCPATLIMKGVGGVQIEEKENKQNEWSVAFQWIFYSNEMEGQVNFPYTTRRGIIILLL